MLIVDGEKYLAEIKELIIEYTNSLNRDFSFQNIDAELEDLKRRYLWAYFSGCRLMVKLLAVLLIVTIVINAVK